MRVVVHIGAQRTASDALYRNLLTNVDVLAGGGVLVPETGRHEMSPNSVRHHLLPWSLDPEGRHPYQPDVWNALAEEMRSSTAQTVLLSSDLFAPVAADPELAPLMLGRLRALSDDVTVVFFAREQLGLLNSLYCQRVKSFELSCDFDTYLAQSSDTRVADLAASFRPWYDGDEVSFIALPWDPAASSHALAALVTECDIPVDPDRLVEVPATDTQDLELGPVGIEATRLLGAYLRGRFPDFSFGEPAARRLSRRAVTVALANGWCGDEYWGWDTRQADEARSRYAASNQEFARRTWGSEWNLPGPRDRARNVADLVELNSYTVNRVHLFLTDMEKVFQRLRTRAAAA